MNVKPFTPGADFTHTVRYNIKVLTPLKEMVRPEYDDNRVWRDEPIYTFIRRAVPVDVLRAFAGRVMPNKPDDLYSFMHYHMHIQAKEVPEVYATIGWTVAERVSVDEGLYALCAVMYGGIPAKMVRALANRIAVRFDLDTTKLHDKIIRVNEAVLGT